MHRGAQDVSGGAGFQNRSRPRATAIHSAVWRRLASHAVSARTPSTPAPASPKNPSRARPPPARNWTMAAITTALIATRCEGGSRRVPLREREREPDSAGLHSPPVKLAGGQGEPFGGRRREDVAQAGQDEADADRRPPGDARLGAQESVNQQAEKQEAGGLACDSDGGPAELCVGQRVQGVGEAARREHNRVDGAGADDSPDGPLHPAPTRDGGSRRVDGRRRARLAAGRPC